MLGGFTQTVTASAAHATRPPIIKTNSFIIQKYIEQPALVKRRKFDIRVWVFVSHEMEVFFFKEGYLRTSSHDYSNSKNDLDDDYIHLTNNAIQKSCPTYGVHEDGNMISFDEFRKYLKTNCNTEATTTASNLSAVDFDKDILPVMKYQAAASVIAVRKKLNVSKKKQCFELFGFDFILDQDYNTWLIEVNTNPCLEESSKLLQRLLPRMIDDMLKLTLDKVFMPEQEL